MGAYIQAMGVLIIEYLKDTINCGYKFSDFGDFSGLV